MPYFYKVFIYSGLYLLYVAENQAVSVLSFPHALLFLTSPVTQYINSILLCVPGEVKKSKAIKKLIRFASHVEIK